ncbi:MAG: tRNA (N(6)-L-threonylcarbamoyladenosine(37)-C(2))-methylthiotransferase MtaB [Firmicutes bacterium]|nr:tRNA (N(6)-L-threonylcarbamoyladenosine(37)-C(2))-methylthiotransferase MtaB [Bacillota bacterium]
MKRVAFYTLGCKVNQYETEAMLELFKREGYKVVPPSEIADVYVINTCSVTNAAERKSRQFIRRSKKRNKNSVIAVVGCYSQVLPNEVLDIKEVDIIVGTKNRNKIVELCKRAKKKNERINIVEDIMKVSEFEELAIDNIKGKTRAFLKIQEGCNQFCSYCIIPYARGPIRSRGLDNIIKEVKKLTKSGFKEIVLTGIHVASYGKDIGDIGLMDVLESVHNIEGIERIRLSSIEPTLIDDEFMKKLLKLPKVCNHFHLSLQSGSDNVLKRMNRKYTTSEFKNIVKIIRKHMPNAGITTDVIVGFPGETDEEFKETYNFVKEIGFSKVHVFKYSPKKGTPAAKYKNQINGNIKSKRSNIMIELAKSLTKDFNKKFINKEMDVLFEEENNSYTEGYTNNYIRTMVKRNSSLEGKVIKVKIKDIVGENLLGEISSC